MRAMKIAVACLLFAQLLARGQAQAERTRYAEEACPEVIAALSTAYRARLSCARLYVPEDRAQAEVKWISLFIAKIESRAAPVNPPLFYLAGGPGDAASADLEWWLASDFPEDSDIYLVDQRGTGFARPSLDCPESADRARDSRLADCRGRLSGAGIELAAYSSEANVADLVELLQALDLAPVDIYGQSYGSRLALLLAQALPGRIRALALDGAYPPGFSALRDMALNARATLERLFDDCALDPACARAFPDLKLSFHDVIAALNREPALLEGLAPGAALRLNGDDFAGYIRGMLADANRLDQIPALIAEFAAGRYDALLPLLEADVRPETESHSEGLFFSIFCAEDAAGASSAEIQARSAEAAAHAGFSRAALDIIEHCATWDVPAAQSAALSKTLQVPTLLLSGRYDPITPPTWAEALSGNLAFSKHYVFPAAGHGALQSEACAEDIMRAFLSQPRAEGTADCFETLHPPRFKLSVHHQSS